MRSLLKHLLSVAQVPAPLRRSLRLALASNDVEAMRRHGRALVTGLLRRGDLVRVTVGDGRGPDGLTFALRDHAALLDLSPLIPDTPAPAPPAGPVEAADPLATYDSRLHERLLSAMERAQDHTLSRAGGHGTADILQDVLALLEPTFPRAELRIELFGAAEVPDPPASVGACPREARPFWATTRADGEAVWLPARRELPPWLRETSGDEDGFAAAVAVPLYPPREALPPDAGDEIGEAGLLYVIHTAPIAREALINLALRISRFVTNGWRQTLQMSRLVHTDPLTGVHNRAFFDAQFALELERANRRQAPLVLLLGDIDHFKDVNDRFGHPAGDRVLKSVARELLQGLRRIDIVCRVGGEEFALVLPDTDIAAARDIVTRIQVRIANLRLTDPGVEEALRVTISFGGVAYPEAGETPEDLYRNADRMLYLSKQRGRNRCHFWNPDGDAILTLPRYSAPAD